MNNKEKVYLNDLATRSFRDVADQDYIAARLCYRAGLMIQFVWMAQQAIEKYLKAILLYNGTSAKGVGHDLGESLRRVEAIKRIAFTLSDASRKFVDYVASQGVNRYLEQPHYTRGLELPKLDKCVWELRLYCRVIDYELKHPGNMLDIELRGIHQWQTSGAPHKFKILGGFLEKVLKNRDDPRRAALVWQNFNYGLRHRRRVRIPNHANAINPTHTLHPQHFDLLAKYVQFPKHVRDHFAENKTLRKP